MSYPLFLWLSTIIVGSVAAYVLLRTTATFFMDDLDSFVAAQDQANEHRATVEPDGARDLFEPVIRRTRIGIEDPKSQKRAA